MAVEYEISSDVATVKGVASNTQVASIVKFYTGSITYDDEPTSKYATVTINGKSQRVMLCVAVSGTVVYDDVPCLYSTVSGHRTLNVVAPSESGTPDDVPSLYETIVVDGKTVRALRCVLINQTPNYDGVSSTCTFTDNGKTHTAQLVNKIVGGSIEVIVKGVSPLTLPDAIADSLSYVKAFGGTEQRNLPDGYTQLEYIESSGTQYIDIDVSGDATFIGTAQSTTDSSTTSQVLVANSGASAGHWFGVQSPGAGSSFAKRWGLGATATASSTIDGTTKVDFEITFTQSSQYGTVNDQVLNRESSTSAHTNWIVFAGNTTPLYGFIGKVWGLKVVQNDVLVRNLIPAKNSSNVIGMYDIVNDVFYENAGTGTFAAGGEVVPTPDTPMDIVSNNGKLVFRDTELPVGYKRLKDITFDGEVYYVTDTYLTGADTTSFTINATEAARNVLGCYTGSGSGNNVSFYLNIAGTGNYVRYKGSLYRPMINDGGLGQDYTLSITPTGTTGFDTNVAWTEQEFTCPDKLYIGWLANATSPKFLGTFKGNITVSNRANFVPCERVSDGAIGYYDTYSETFFENQGEGTPTTSGYDYTHNTVVADGTVETINAHGTNLIDLTATTNGYYYDANGDYVQLSNGALTDWIPVKAGQKYTVYVKSTSSASKNVRTNFFNTSKVWQSQEVMTISGSGTVKSATYTVPMDGYIRTSATTNNMDWSVMQIYYNGGTATAEMLLKVGDYQDVQSILDGVVTRNVGVLVLDGTEEIWGTVSQTPDTVTILTNCYTVVIPLGDAPIDKRRVYCTHLISSDTLPAADARQGYALLGNSSAGTPAPLTNKYAIGLGLTTRFPTIAGLKQWLADQYAAGTPVTIVYPLATSTTESVAGQTLQVQAGDNTLEITQASLSGLELEAQYQAAVSLTIQEVQDANLDPNVEVTIN